MCLAAQLCVGWRTGRGIAAVLVCYSSSGTAAGVSAGLDIVGVGVLSQRFRFGKRLSKCTGLFLPTASVSLAPAGRGTGGVSLQGQQGTLGFIAALCKVCSLCISILLHTSP